MRKIVFLLFLLPTISQAQETRNYRVDSMLYYRGKISQMQRKMYDSLRSSEEYRTATERIRHYESLSDGYTSFVLFADVADANYDKFDASLVANGFSPLEDPVLRFGFGFSFKTNRTVVDFLIFASGVQKKSRKGNEKITTNFSNGFILDIGYDLVKQQAINIYPYAGLSLRTSDLSYTKPVQVNPTFTDISNLVQNKQSAEGSSIKLGYQAGVGFDFVVRNEPRKLGGIMVFFKTGINKPIGKESYKIEGVKYDPGIEYGNWIVTAGIKFFGRK